MGKRKTYGAYSRGCEVLRAYLTKRGESNTKFAERAGFSRNYVGMLLRGESPPGKRIMDAINEATSGEVPPTVWFEKARNPRPKFPRMPNFAMR